jgi:hypothetical protein
MQTAYPGPRRGNLGTWEAVRMTDPPGRFFRYATDLRVSPFWAPFGVRPSRDGVRLTDDGRFVATFGWLSVETPLANVDGAHVTDGYRWWTAAGARISLADDGLTFGTNAARGVCVHFHDKVPSKLRRSGHSALTVTVADTDGLVAALMGDVDPPSAAPPVRG